MRRTVAPVRHASTSGLRLGTRYGAFCVGCCWALMLVMFAAGVASLVYMALLTAVMVHEKTHPVGRRAVPVAGVALLASALGGAVGLRVRERCTVATGSRLLGSAAW
jgi:predicted metal-binding membrane protein